MPLAPRSVTRRAGKNLAVQKATKGRFMGIIGWILLGLLAGLIAKAILPGDDPGGIIVTLLLGVAGALLGGFIARALGLGDPINEFFDISTWIAAIIGAIILLLIYRMIFGRRTGMA